MGANVDPPKLNFSTDYISARRVCWPLKFLHALEIVQGLLAHPRAASRWALPHISSYFCFVTAFVSNFVNNLLMISAHTNCINQDAQAQFVANFFIDGVVNAWNLLPPTVNFTSLLTFKSSLSNVDFFRQC